MLPNECHTITEAHTGGGLSVTMVVPCAEGEARFSISAERTKDGDWVVTVPCPRVSDGEMRLLADSQDSSRDYDYLNGVVYLAGPEDDEDPSGHAAAPA